MPFISFFAKAATAAFLSAGTTPALADDMSNMAGMSGHATAQKPDSQTYRFELVGTPKPLNAKQYAVSVSVIHAVHNVTLPGVEFTQIGLDMSPDNMPTMTAPVKQVPSKTQGVYLFAFDNAVWADKGHWALILAAKIKGEPQPVSGRVVFQTGL